MIEIYCDGSARNNGKENNCGGWGLAIFKNETLINYFGEQVENTTNNRMELIALLKALEISQKNKDEEVIIYSDSAYCVNIFNEWIWGWAAKNWIRANNKPIENLDLIKQLWKYRNIEWENFQIKKISGHTGIIGNEIADAVATQNENKLKTIFKKKTTFPSYMKI